MKKSNKSRGTSLPANLTSGERVPPPAPPPPPLPPQIESNEAPTFSEEYEENNSAEYADLKRSGSVASIGSIASIQNGKLHKMEPTNFMRIRVESWGYEDSRRLGSIFVNGQVLASFSDKDENFRGIHLITFKKIDSLYNYDQYVHFDVWKNQSEAESLKTFIESLPKETIVVGGSADEVQKNLKFAEPALQILDLNLDDFSYRLAGRFFPLWTNIGLVNGQHIAGTANSYSWKINLSNVDQYRVRGATAFAATVGYSGVKKSTKKHEGPVILKTVMNVQTDSQVVTPAITGIIKPSELHKQMKLLKAAKTVTPTNVDKKKLFLKDDSESFFPLKRIKTMFDVPFEQAVVYVDFTGIEQLTDVFFYLISNQARLATALSHVKHVSIRGCLHVTDLGVKWMTEGLPNLVSIASQSCRLTEKSIHYLVKNCKKIETIALVGANIGNLYLPESYDLGALKLKACPLVMSEAFHKTVQESSSIVARNSYFQELRKEPPLKVYKAVIIKSSDLVNVSVLNILSRKPSETKNLLGNLDNYKLLEKDITVNFTECTQEVADIYLTERTLYVLPYNADAPLLEAKYDVVNRITHVLAQIPTASFYVLPIKQDTEKDESNKEKSSELLDRQTICQGLDKKVKHYMKGNGKHHMRILDSQQKELNFKEQIILGKGIAMSYNIVDVIEDSARIIVSSEDIKTANWRTDFLTNVGKGIKTIEHDHPWFKRFSKEFKDLVQQCTFTEKIMTEGEFVRKLKEINASELSDYVHSYLKATEYLHMLGVIVHVKPQPYTSGPECQGIVITDPNWLVSVFNKILSGTGSPTLQGKYSVVTKVTPVWNKKDLEKLLSSMVTSDKMNLLNELMMQTSLWMDVDDLSGVFTPHIDEEPPVDKLHYFGDYLQKDATNQDNFSILKCQYKVFQPLPASFFMKLAGNPVMSYSSVWKYGLITTDLPVESLIFWENVDSSDYLPTISIVCQQPKSSTENSAELNYLWTEMHKFTTVVEALFKQYGFTFTVQTECNGSPVEKPEHIHGIICDCYFSEMNIKCRMCENKFKHSQLLWQMDHYLKPTFCGEIPGLLIDNSQTVKKTKFIKGNWISTSKKDRIELLSKLKAEDNCTIELSLKIGNYTEFGIAGDLETVVINVTKCCVELLKPTPDNTDVVSRSVICSMEPEMGDTLSISLYRNQDMKLYAMISKNFLPICHTVLTDCSEGFTPFLQTGEMCGVIVNISRSMVFSKTLSLKEGMRLEALDKVYDDRVCVATVDEIRKNGEIRIHFDGWTNKYDYWTTMADPYIHPVGYFSQKATVSKTYKEKQRKLLKDLQPPKQSLGKSFDWNIYLQQIKEWPVPYTLFTKEQTDGCKPFVMSSDTLHVLTGSSCSNSCEIQLYNRPAKFKKDILEILAKGKELYEKSVASSSKYVPVVCLMPQLTIDKVGHPSMQSFFGQKKESASELQVLCPYHYNHHFLNEDSPKEASSSKSMKKKEDKKVRQTKITVSAQDVKSITPYLIAVVSQLLQQKFLFPNNIEKAFPELTSLSLNELNTGMRQILGYQLIYCSLQLGTTLPTVLSDEQIQAVKKVIGEDEEKNYDDMLCQAHYTAMNFHKTGASSFEMEMFKDYSNLISKMYIGMTDSEEASEEVPKLKTLPDNFFTSFTQLTHLVLKGHEISFLPPNLHMCTQLELLDVSDNPISQLDGIALVKSTLTALDISHTNIIDIPKDVYQCTKLQELRADKIEMHTLSNEIGNLVELRILSLAENCLTDIPCELEKCKELVELDLSGIKWSNKNLLSYHNFTEMLNDHPYTAKIDEKTKRQYFQTSEQKVFLNESEVGKLNLFMFMEFPRLRVKEGEKWNIIETITQLEKLELLNISYQGFTVVPLVFQKFTNLATLNVSHNPVLESVAAEISTLKQLTSLELKGCPSLKTPPREIVSKGFKAVYGYLRRLLTGSVECKRTKLMMVGLGGAGKTSLVSKFVRGNTSYSYDNDEASEVITDGIDIVDWAVKTDNGGVVTYSIWDFAGQSVYYNTHQFFLSNRAVYLLMWNIRLGYEHAGLDFWLSSIACHAPKAPVIVVGTHRDQVDKFWLPEEEMRKKYPQIRNFHAISVFKNIGVKDLVQDLINITLQEKYMGEKIPEAWLNFEKKMTLKKKDVSLLMWKEVEELAEHSGLMDKIELFQAVGFLHDLGSVQHFKNMFLRNRVVINPQWIVDAMACVVSVHETPIVDGNFFHRDVKKVWKDYPEELHPWLLRLTEEFDLTFPLRDRQANIVPCLLPPSPPEFKWLNVEDIPGFHETKMMYKFEYLPAGLFNRAQVRLYQFCDSSVIWKKGSKLMKNGHHALMEQISDKVVVVKAQGYRPANVLFLVHEVFESLIAESFHGVTYDYFVPCPDCLKVDCYDPCLFAASKVTRATELRAPFLQCDKYFHNISLIEVQAAMPPSSNSDFDIHLERTVRDLEDIQSDLVADVFMVYCAEDIPQIGEENTKIKPRRICDDLNNNGFKVWFPIDPANINLQLVSGTMRDAKLVLICISDNFVANQAMCDIFHYAKTNLQKNIQLVVLGSTLNWKNSTTGLLVTDEVFVNMKEPERYPHKIKELIEKVKQKTSTDIVKNQPTIAFPKCFISYSWTNSADAIKKGSKPVPGSIGWADPRELKNLLEENGIPCWLDVEKMGQGGLFEEIADGLKNAKVMVACVSDEYAKSKNCQLEFRFASITLKIPMVIAVVGTGLKWESSEVGMLSLGAPKIMFQYDSPTAHDRLVNAVKQLLPEGNDDGYESRTPSADDNNQAAFQELLELAQRKFLRQVTHIAESKGYPRLFVLDFLSQVEKEEHAKKMIIEGNIPENDKLDKDTSSNIEKDESEKDSKKDIKGSVASLRPRSAIRKRTSGLTAVMASLAIAQLATEQIPEEDVEYCARFLCEHEQGWHCHGESLPIKIKPRELEDTLNTMAPYMARILAILKYECIDLEIVTSEKGDKLRRRLEEKCGTEPEFGKEYEEMRDFVMKLDEEKHMGSLARCQLPSGKIVWLCPKHHEDDHITVLGTDDNMDIQAGPDEDTITSSMLDELNKIKPVKEQQQQNKTSERPVPKGRKSNLAASNLKAQGKQAGANEAAKLAGGLQPGTNKSKACSVM